MSDHTCHAISCTAEIPPRLFMCRKHWDMLPKLYQNLIWKYYKRGQEKNKDPSPQYLWAAFRAKYALALIEGTATDRQAVIGYLKRRKMMIEKAYGVKLSET